MISGSPSVAVRVYTYDNITKLDGSFLCSTDSVTGGVDGLQFFRDSFEHSIVFFVLPTGQQQRDQLGRRESFVNAAQHSLLARDKGGEDENRKKVCRC
jgi:hypothetical protein